MTDTGPPPVNALVEALEARARQAGSEGAMTLLRGMLGTLSETMTSIEERLGRLEARADDQSGEMALAEAVQSALTSFNARLGRLEEAFVQAVEESGSGTQQIVDQIREAVMASLPSPSLDAPADRSDPEPPPPPPPSAAEVAGEVVGGMRRLLETHTSALGQRFNAIDQRLGALERVEDSVRELRDRPVPDPASFVPAEPARPALDPELVARLEAAIDALGSGEAAARTVALIEERIAAVVRVIGERSDEVRNAIRQELEAMPRPTPPPLDLSALTRIEDAVRRLAERPLPEPVDLSALASVEEQVRRLAERPVPEPVDLSALASVEEQVRRLAERPVPEPVDLSPLARVEEAVQRLAERPSSEPVDVSALASIEEAVRRLADRPSPEPVDLSALASVEEQVRRLAERPSPEPVDLSPLARIEEAVQRVAERPSPEPVDVSALARIEEAIRRLADRPSPEPVDVSALTRIEEAVQRVAERAAPEPVDLTALGRIEEEVRRLAERPVPEPPPLPEPVDLSALARIEEQVRRLAERPVPEPPPVPEPVDLSALARIEDELRRLVERPLPELPQPLPPVAPPPIEIPVYELSDIVRRESELLTQRVAALAVGVEATRALVEQLASDMEASLGRKATEVGRRLATDLGLRSRRATKRRDRELGPGA